MQFYYERTPSVIGLEKKTTKKKQHLYNGIFNILAEKLYGVSITEIVPSVGNV